MSPSLLPRTDYFKRDARGMTQEKLAAEVEAKLKQEEEMQAQRKLDSKELAGDTIRRELAERELDQYKSLYFLTPYNSDMGH